MRVRLVGLGGGPLFCGIYNGEVVRWRVDSIVERCLFSRGGLADELRRALRAYAVEIEETPERFQSKSLDRRRELVDLAVWIGEVRRKADLQRGLYESMTLELLEACERLLLFIGVPAP